MMIFILALIRLGTPRYAVGYADTDAGTPIRIFFPRYGKIGFRYGKKITRGKNIHIFPVRLSPMSVHVGPRPGRPVTVMTWTTDIQIIVAM